MDWDRRSGGRSGDGNYDEEALDRAGKLRVSTDQQEKAF
jgi:hypothetical protein